ncbi:hypothetical protein FKP32DRAFT_1590207 [Trametes sanguinea]|nr:hypothetical protein FKP32DRAFT_1590207 [Trametes sanguinea]
MIPDSFYIHPRPLRLYETPSMHKPTDSGKKAPRSPTTRSTRAVDVRTATVPQPTMTNSSDFGCAVDKRSSFSVCSPEESYITENVAEVLRHKQRMRARQALDSLATSSGEYRLRGHSRSLSSSSSSTASSPASSPPSTPRLMPVDLPFPEQGDELVVIESMRSRSDSNTSTGGAEGLSMLLLSPSKASSGPHHRPSRSRSSIIQKSLSRASRASSRSSVASTPPPSTSTMSTSAIMDLVKRLAPLPRFNPYRRARAESMSALVDERGHHQSGAFCGLLPRRRCQSAPSPTRPRL